MKVGNKTIKHLFVATTHDKYELPIAVADSAYELGKMLGRPANSIASAISQGRPYIYKIYVGDED